MMVPLLWKSVAYVAKLEGAYKNPLCYTWRFMDSYKSGYKSPIMGYNYSYPTYNPTYN